MPRSLKNTIKSTAYAFSILIIMLNLMAQIVVTILSVRVVNFFNQFKLLVLRRRLIFTAYHIPKNDKLRALHHRPQENLL